MSTVTATHTIEIQSVRRFAGVGQADGSILTSGTRVLNAPASKRFVDALWSTIKVAFMPGEAAKLLAEMEGNE